MSWRSRGLSDRKRANSPWGSTTQRVKWSNGMPSTGPATAASSSVTVPARTSARSGSSAAATSSRASRVTALPSGLRRTTRAAV
jgi:hypothetical protein